MRGALGGFEGPIRIGCRIVTNLQYANINVSLLVGSAGKLHELQEMFNSTQVANSE